jgi:hypothetical protein
MKLPRKAVIALFLMAIFQHPSALIADTILPHKFEFTESKEHYYMLAVLDSSDETQLKGFQVFDTQNNLIQFIDFEEDLSHKVPEFIQGGLPGAQPVRFEDCNFDGFGDALFREDISPRFQSFDIWLWNSKEKKFIFDQQLNDAEINFIDPKTKTLGSGGSEGHGEFGFKTYNYSPSGKLTLISTDFISNRENSEVKTYYIDGQASKVVKTAAPAEAP